jgi:hypothetical protein
MLRIDLDDIAARLEEEPRDILRRLLA